MASIDKYYAKRNRKTQKFNIYVLSIYNISVDSWQWNLLSFRITKYFGGKTIRITFIVLADIMSTLFINFGLDCHARLIVSKGWTLKGLTWHIGA